MKLFRQYLPSITAFCIKSQYSSTADGVSSFPGIGYVTKKGSWSLWAGKRGRASLNSSPSTIKKTNNNRGISGKAGHPKRGTERTVDNTIARYLSTMAIDGIFIRLHSWSAPLLTGRVMNTTKSGISPLLSTCSQHRVIDCVDNTSGNLL